MYNKGAGIIYNNSADNGSNLLGKKKWMVQEREESNCNNEVLKEERKGVSGCKCGEGAGWEGSEDTPFIVMRGKIEDEWLKESVVGRGGESHWVLPIVLVK